MGQQKLARIYAQHIGVTGATDGGHGMKTHAVAALNFEVLYVVCRYRDLQQKVLADLLIKQVWVFEPKV